MQAQATARYIRMSPRKVRLIADLIRGKEIAKAQVQLAFALKAAKGPILKLLESAIANAQAKKLTVEKL